MSELPVGTSINGTWVVQKVLFPERASEGATYVVARAESEETCLCQDVGPSPASEDGVTRNAYNKAVEAVRGMPHPNLAPIVDMFSTGGREYLVLESPHAVSLESVAHSNGEAGNRTLREWGNQICDAFGALDSKLPCLMLDQVDPAQIMGDDGGHFRLVNYRLGRCLSNGGKVLGESEEDRAVNYKTCAELLSFVATKKKSKTDLASVKAFNPKMAAVVQRCQAYLQYPGLSFQEIKRTLWQALPEEAVEKRSKLQMEGLGVLQILRSIPPRNYLIAATAVATVSLVVNLFQTRVITWSLDKAAYVICNASFVDYIDATTFKVTHKLPINSQMPNLTNLAVLVDGGKLVVCDRGAREVQSFSTDDHKSMGPGYGVAQTSFAPITMFSGSVHDRSVWVVGGGYATEVAVAPALLAKRTVSVGNVSDDAVYAMSPDHTYMFVSRPRYGEIRVINVPELHMLKIGITAPSADKESCMAVSSDSKELWVGNAKSNTIYVQTLQSLQDPGRVCGVDTIATISPSDSDFRASAIKFSPDGATAAILSAETNSLLLVDTASHKITQVVHLQGRHPVACSFANDTLWVSNQDSNSVDVVTLSGGTIFKSIKVDGSPSDIVYAQNNQKAP